MDQRNKWKAYMWKEFENVMILLEAIPLLIIALVALALDLITLCIIDSNWIPIIVFAILVGAFYQLKRK